jgi:hypothetical protein
MDGITPWAARRETLETKVTQEYGSEYQQIEAGGKPDRAIGRWRSGQLDPTGTLARRRLQGRRPLRQEGPN